MALTVFQNETAPLAWEDECDYAIHHTTEPSPVPSGVTSLGLVEGAVSHETSVSPSPSRDFSSGLDESHTDEAWAHGSKVQGHPGHQSHGITVSLPFSTLTQPRSLFDGFVAPAPVEREARALQALLEEMGPQPADDDYIEIELDCFCVYMDGDNYPIELRPLQHLSIRPGCTRMFFDGVVRHGDREFFLRRISFSSLPVGGYGEGEHTVGDQIWILSDLNERSERPVYYKLRSPAPEYRRFHTPFLWIADFTKHVIDYCDHLHDGGGKATLADFESRFNIWTLRKHRHSSAFTRWHSQHGSTDFRTAIVSNMNYIWKESYGLNPKSTSWHRFWNEIKSLDRYKVNLKPTQIGEMINGEPKTIVTPYVFDLFHHMVFGQMLESKDPISTAEEKRQKFLESIELPSQDSQATTRTAKRVSIEDIQPGDVISTKPDDDSTDTRWKMSASKHSLSSQRVWYGLVQSVRNHGQGRRTFDVLWLYQPEDTPCSVMKYPWPNELFLSDNCTCHHDTARVRGSEILGTHEVEWFGNPSTSAEFFVRQTYVASTCRWTSLKREHFICDEDVFSPKPTYNVGDAVLAHAGTDFLENFVVEELLTNDDRQLARLRRLWRRREVDATSLAPPNELVYSDQFIELPVQKIERSFLLRLFHIDEKIPSPYDRNGTGEAFFITHREVEINGIISYSPLETEFIASISRTLRQGFDPTHRPEIQKLRGLDLFCGGGNFGRGLEDAGAVEMRWANDIWTQAMHSYMANTDPRYCQPFLGSVDNLLGMALEGNSRVPGPGEVEFISAGSPCPGFSSLTLDRTTDHQRKNQSLVASFASYVDFYRPIYGLLENVPTMVENSRDTCVFSQLVCALVGLGYQVQVLFLDAWSFGGPQSRTRVFLSFTAAGWKMPNPPALSHSHPDHVKPAKLGIMTCGLPFDSRRMEITPLKFVSVEEATRDLPNVQDGKADYCIGYPDHRLSNGLTPAIRKQLEQIPTHPYGMSFSKAWWGYGPNPPVMSATARQLFHKDGTDRVKRSSRGWGRLAPNGLAPTISTRITPTDARTGFCNHWQENRPLTILEARRAQGYLDHEVLIGLPTDQYRIIGNSVSRHVSLALGLTIREAWLGTLFDESNAAPAITSTATQTQPVDVIHITEEVVEVTETRLQVNTETDLGVELEGYTSTDCSSEEPFAMSTPGIPGLLTPASSTESVEAELGRKRTLPLFVGVASKRQKQVIDLHCVN